MVLSRAVACVLLALAGCSQTTPDYRWIGALTSSTPTTCPPTRGVALLRNGAVTFAPDEGTWVLTGTATPDGKLEADRDRESAKTSFDTHLEGSWSPAQLIGTYTTPKCRYAVALKRY